jgi:protease I
MSSVLMVVAPTMFRDEEYEQPRAVFESRGASVTVASVCPGPITGRFGARAIADVAIVDADPGRYDALVFVGGAGAEVFFDDRDAHALARRAHDLGKVVAAICIAPSILARAGLLSGRQVTSFPDQEADLTSHGAIWTGQRVTVDAPFVTANGPESAREFGEAVAALAGL